MAKTEIDDTQIKPGTSNQILGVNNAGTVDEYKTLSGTTNQIIKTDGAGTITLSTPQDIGTGSSVTFGQITDSGLTANTALTANGSKQLTSSSTTSTELGYVSGVVASIQTQLYNDETNELSNGGFESWSNGTSFSNPSPGAVLADHWTVSSSSGTTTISQESTNVDTGAFALKVVLGTSSQITIKNPIANYKEYLGQTVSLYIRVRIDAGSSSPQINVLVRGANASTSSTIAFSTVDSTYHTGTVSYTVPANATTLQVEIGTNTSGTMTAYVDSVALILGSVVPNSYVIPRIIANADVDASAAISYSKLNLSNSILATDIASGQVVKTLNTFTDSVSIVGTTNQINIVNSSNTITLSTPQDIATSSSPTFSAVTITNLFLTGVASDPGSPTAGQIWWNTTNNQIIFYNGSTKVILG